MLSLFEVIGLLERLLEEGKVGVAQDVFKEHKDKLPNKVKSSFSDALFEADLSTSALKFQNNKPTRKQAKRMFHELFKGGVK